MSFTHFVGEQAIVVNERELWGIDGRKVDIDAYKTAKIVGTITDVFEEDGYTWGLIDDSYAVKLDGSYQTLDICGIAKSVNPLIKGSFVKLSPLYN